MFGGFIMDMLVLDLKCWSIELEVGPHVLIAVFKQLKKVVPHFEKYPTLILGRLPNLRLQILFDNDGIHLVFFHFF